jgi:hypothetical protein
MKVYGNSGGGTDFDPCPEGMHQAICVDMVDLGMVPYEYQGKHGERREVRFAFLVDVRDENDNPIRQPMADGKEGMHYVGQKFTASLAPNARLVPFLESWTGKTIPDEIRESGFDLEALIGRNAMLVIVHKEGKGRDGKPRVYANIKGVTPVAKNAPKLKLTDEEVKGYIRVREREGYQPPVGSDDYEAQQAAKRAGAKPAPVGAGGDDEDEGDDLPF